MALKLGGGGLFRKAVADLGCGICVICEASSTTQVHCRAKQEECGWRHGKWSQYKILNKESRDTNYWANYFVLCKKA